MIYQKIKTNSNLVIKIFGLTVYTVDISGNTKHKKFLYGLTSRLRVIEGYNELKINRFLGAAVYRTARNKDFVKIYALGILIKTVNIKQALYKSLAKTARGYDDIFILNSNIGEAFCILFYLSRALSAKAGKRKVLFCVTRESLLSIAGMFAGNIPCVYIRKIEYSVPDFCWTLGGKNFYMFPAEYFLEVENKARAGAGAHYFTEVLNLFGVNKAEVKPQEIIVPQSIKRSALAKAAKMGLNNNNFIFISPYANSCALLPREFWLKLGAKLKKKGYDVFENSEENGFTLAEAFALALMSQAVIGLRSGLMEILTQTAVPMQVIYTDFRQRAVFGELPSKSVLSGFTLKKLPAVKSNITEYDAAEFTLEELLAVIDV
ncbi:MAG: hypothetical protein LBL61_06035 [Elusimicrobiota bacterium]|jgi:hypothetical protein|nr:hypothetical protein [Elusimicrobiota bacterium]